MKPARALCFFSFLVLFVLLASSAFAWYNNYGFRKQISIQTANLDSDLANFPLYVYINADTDIGGNISSCDEIVFTDSSDSLLAFEKESCSISEGAVTADYWVNVTSISTGGTNIYAYYGLTDASDLSNASGTWNASYISVWHFGEAGWDGTANEVKDSTGNAKHGTANSAATTTASGKVGRAGNFVDGTDDYVNLGTYTNLDGATAFTVEAWLYDADVETFGAYRGVFARGLTGNRVPWVSGTSGASTITTWCTIDGIANAISTASPSISDTTWTHWGVAFDSATNLSYDYWNGAYVDTDAVTRNVVTATNGYNFIGYINLYGAWQGYIDEMRISTLAHPAAWLKFEYWNIFNEDHELDWFAQEVNPVIPEFPGAMFFVVLVSSFIVLFFVSRAKEKK